jgi:hypothetical protein
VAACLADTGHCCWLNGEACRFLRDDGAGAARRWVCTLRERAGSWDDAYRLPEYVEHVRPTLTAIGLPDCGDWPRPGETCNECGARDG